MKLAHEFKRSSYREMLREMTISEYFSWYKYFSKRPFTFDLIDYGYSTIASSVYNVAAMKQVTTAQDFSLLNLASEKKSEMTDEEIMEVSGANAGVLRIGPDQ